MKLGYGQKKVLRLLSNKRGQMPKTLEKKLGSSSHILHPNLSFLVEKGLVKRKQVPVKSTGKMVSHKTKTKYFITEKGLDHL